MHAQSPPDVARCPWRGPTSGKRARKPGHDRTRAERLTFIISVSEPAGNEPALPKSGS